MSNPFDQQDDSSLIDAALNGRREAFDALVRRHQDRLFSSMLQMTGNPDEAEDVVQDAFVRGYIKLDTFKRDSQFFTWLYRIAFNSALGNRRKAKKKYSLDEMRENLGEEPILEDDAPDASIIRDEDVSLIRRAMERLSDAHRDILVLREMQDHAYEEIAAILSISIGTVRSRLSRARASLKEQIETLQTK